MELVYDTAIQSEIEHIQNRIATIIDEGSKLHNTSMSLNLYERFKNSYYHPLDNNIEYQNLKERLEQIYLYAVPRFLLASDEYNQFKNLHTSECQ